MAPDHRPSPRQHSQTHSRSCESEAQNSDIAPAPNPPAKPTRSAPPQAAHPMAKGSTTHTAAESAPVYLQTPPHRPPMKNPHLNPKRSLTDPSLQSDHSFGCNPLIMGRLQKPSWKSVLTTNYLDGSETFSAVRIRSCCASGLGSLVTVTLSLTS